MGLAIVVGCSRPEPGGEALEENGPATVDSGAGGGESAAGHESPQAAFTDAQAALRSKEYEAFAKNLTPEGQASLAGVLAMFSTAELFVTDAGLEAARQEASSSEEMKAKIAQAETQQKDLKDVLAKHGLDEDSRKNMKPAGGMEAFMRQLGDKVADKPQFIAEVIRTLDAIRLTRKDSPQPEGPILDEIKPLVALRDGELGDVQVSGTTAVGTLAGTEGASPEKVTFQQTAGEWLIEWPNE